MGGARAADRGADRDELGRARPRGRRARLERSAARELQDQVIAEVADGNIIEITGHGGHPGAGPAARRPGGPASTSRSPRRSPAIPTDASGQLQQEQQEALRRADRADQRADHRPAQLGVQGRPSRACRVRTELEALRSSLAEAVTTLDEAEAAARPNMVVMGPADRPAGPPRRRCCTSSRAARAVLPRRARPPDRRPHGPRMRGEDGDRCGARHARARRPRRAGCAAAAGGRPWPAGPDAPVLGADVRWHVPAPQTAGDEAGRQIRYRRVLRPLA